jgi:hypothetical protein
VWGRKATRAQEHSFPAISEAIDIAEEIHLKRARKLLTQAGTRRGSACSASAALVRLRQAQARIDLAIGLIDAAWASVQRSEDFTAH